MNVYLQGCSRSLLKSFVLMGNVSFPISILGKKINIEFWFLCTETKRFLGKYSAGCIICMCAEFERKLMEGQGRVQEVLRQQNNFLFSSKHFSAGLNYFILFRIN